MKAIISRNCRIRYPECFTVKDYSIVDDYCYFSTKVEIGMYSHIASGCSIAGGQERLFSLGDYCSISSGVKIWCSSNDYVNDLVVIAAGDLNTDDIPIEGDVMISNMCGVGANTVIMPNNNMPEGVAIGALSFVPAEFDFKPWSVYAGIPVKLVKQRNKKNVMRQKNQIEKVLKLRADYID